jgi:alpha-D-ribose 1-methylphosphonate 5-triphosphate synthase subunit PhnG
MTTTLTVNDRAELLAVADAEEVVALAESCLAQFGDPVLLAPPEVGLVVMQVREPVCAERFHLGEVVVTRAEVEVAGARGWAMRLGNDRVATLAAAVCDAVAAAGGALSADVEQLCANTHRRRVERQAAEWDAIAPTIVAFEELT